MIDRKVFVRLLLTIGLPIVLQQIISLSLNMIDTFMIGSIGVGELAAVGAANKVYFIFSIICFGIYSGSSIYVSQYWGIRDVENIRKVIAIEMRIGFFLALFTVGLALVFAPQILHLFVREPDVVAIGASYLRITCFTYLMTAFSFLMSFNSRAIHNLKVPTLASVLAITVNTVLNYGLIFGNFHLPRLGVEGAAIATLTARFVEMLLILGYVYFSEDHPLAVDGATIRRLDVPLMKRVVKTALPVAMSESAWSIGTTVCFIAYGLLGTSAVAVVQVASVINDLFQCVFFGLGNACAVMIGNELGRNHTKLAYSYGRVFIGINIGFCLVMTAALLLMKGRIIDIYNYDAATSRMLNLTLIAYALYTTPKMMSYVHICGILRSGGDTKFCMFCDLIGIWCVAIPMSFLAAAVWRLPLHWVVALSFSDELVKAMVTLWRFRSKKWIHVLVRREQECEISGA